VIEPLLIKPQQGTGLCSVHDCLNAPAVIVGAAVTGGPDADLVCEGPGVAVLETGETIIACDFCDPHADQLESQGVIRLWQESDE
jgi:hypothetical protein